jgi:hypothetical protein
MGVLALVAAGIVGAAIWRNGNAHTTGESAAAAANGQPATGSPAGPVLPATGTGEATGPASMAAPGVTGTSADQANDAGTADSSSTADAGARTIPPWRRGGKGKPAKKDLGF